ncbi:Chemotaxis response regulator protein-glutamate methylesterase [Mycobacterium persicum]|uniref:protein-glutamate methylesterase n=2 Tax=Mycobacterium persicum TaxID=1487726 RepID=A0AB38V0I0_9MYCO|nr:Chemotaxis response regulator protein-glutamate methylesterase [Mycobacterium persicum]
MNWVFRVVMQESEFSKLRGVVVGASAGGVQALRCLASGLSPDLPYAYLVTLHLPPGAPSVLAQILDRSGPLPAVPAEHGAALQQGRIYVATPDRHLLVSDHRVVLSQGPTENGHRPAINALFRSAALAFGPRAIGVLLSGVLDDGVLGLAAIRARGGTTIGQTAEDALFPSMPTNARHAGVLDREAAAADIGAVLKELSHREIKELTMEPDIALELENRIAMASPFSTDFDTQQLGTASGYTCPDCHGSLVSIGEGHYRCRVGHAWTADALLTARDEIEGALWVALRSLQEKARLARHLADKAGHGPVFRRYSARAEGTERALAVLSQRLSAGVPHRGHPGDDDD